MAYFELLSGKSKPLLTEFKFETFWIKFYFICIWHYLFDLLAELAVSSDYLFWRRRDTAGFTEGFWVRNGICYFELNEFLLCPPWFDRTDTF